MRIDFLSNSKITSWRMTFYGSTIGKFEHGIRPIGIFLVPVFKRASPETLRMRRAVDSARLAEFPPQEHKVLVGVGGIDGSDLLLAKFFWWGEYESRLYFTTPLPLFGSFADGAGDVPSSYDLATDLLTGADGRSYFPIGLRRQL